MSKIDRDSDEEGRCSHGEEKAETGGVRERRHKPFCVVDKMYHFVSSTGSHESHIVDGEAV